MTSSNCLHTLMAVIALALAAPAHSAELKRADDVLNFAIQKNEGYQSYSADFTQTIGVLGTEIVMPGTIQFKKPELMRMSMTVPFPGHEQHMQVIVGSDKIMWQQVMMGGQTNIVKMNFQVLPANGPGSDSMPNPLESVDPKMQLKQAQERYTFALLPGVTNQGQPMYVLEGILKSGVKLDGLEKMMSGKMGHQKIYIGQQDGFMHRFEQFDESGSNTLMAMEITNLKVNIPLNDQLFVYTPPADAAIMDMTQDLLEKMRGLSSSTSSVPNIVGPAEPAPPIK